MGLIECGATTIGEERDRRKKQTLGFVKRIAGWMDDSVESGVGVGVGVVVLPL